MIAIKCFFKFSWIFNENRSVRRECPVRMSRSTEQSLSFDGITLETDTYWVTHNTRNADIGDRLSTNQTNIFPSNGLSQSQCAPNFELRWSHPCSFIPRKNPESNTEAHLSCIRSYVPIRLQTCNVFENQSNPGATTWHSHCTDLRFWRQFEFAKCSLLIAPRTRSTVRILDNGNSIEDSYEIGDDATQENHRSLDHGHTRRE